MNKEIFICIVFQKNIINLVCFVIKNGDSKEAVIEHKVTKNTSTEKDNFTYKNNGDLESAKNNSSAYKEFKYIYDGNGRISSIKINNQNLVDVAYSMEYNNVLTDLPTTITQSGIYTHFEYNPSDLEVDRLKKFDGDTLIEEVRFNKDTSRSKITSIEQIRNNVTNTETYTYDEKNRIEKVENEDLEIDYAYDNMDVLQGKTIKIGNSISHSEYDYPADYTGYTFSNFMMRNASKYEEVYTDFGLRLESQHGQKISYYLEQDVTMQNYDIDGLMLNNDEGFAVSLNTINKERYDNQEENERLRGLLDERKTAYIWFKLHRTPTARKDIMKFYANNKEIGLCLGTDGRITFHTAGVYSNFGSAVLTPGWHFLYLSIADTRDEYGYYPSLTISIDEKIYHLGGIYNSPSSEKFHTFRCMNNVYYGYYDNLTVKSLTIGAYEHTQEQIRKIYDYSKKFLTEPHEVMSAVRMKNEDIYGNMELVTLLGSLTSSTGRKPIEYTHVDDLYQGDKGRLFEYDIDSRTHVYSVFNDSTNDEETKSRLIYDFNLDDEATISIKFKPKSKANNANNTIIHLENSQRYLWLYLNGEDYLAVKSESFDRNTGFKVQRNKWYDIVLRISGTTYKVDIATSGWSRGQFTGVIASHNSIVFDSTGMKTFVGHNEESVIYNFNGQMKMLAVCKDECYSDVRVNKLFNTNGIIEDKKIFDKFGRIGKKESNILDSKYETNYEYKSVPDIEYGSKTTFEVNKVTRNCVSVRPPHWQNYYTRPLYFEDATEVYSYENGNVVEKIVGNVKTTYTYDYQNRLKSEDVQFQVKQVCQYHEIEYLPNGNIYKKTYKSSKNGSIMSIDTYNYDTVTTNGFKWEDRLVSITKNNGGQTFNITYGNNLDRPATYGNKSLTWQGRNLTAINNEVQYTYNHNGIRTSKTVNGVTTKYYLEGSKILAEKKDGSPIVCYNYDENDQLIGFEYDGFKYFYIRDILGNINYIMDSTGEVVVSYIYDAWGNIINSHVMGSYGSTIRSVNSFHYKGYYLDSETSWYYLNSRYYDPSIGRFINSDSTKYLDLDSIGGMNLFAYCLNNPVMYYDPSGYFAITTAIIVGAIIGAVVGATAGGIIAYNWAYDAGYRGQQLAGWTLLGIGGGGIIGGVIGGAIGYMVPYISGFAAKALTFGAQTFVGTNGALIATAGVTITGAQVLVGGGVITLGGIVMMAKDSYVEELKKGMTQNQKEKFKLEIEGWKKSEGRRGDQNLPKKILEYLAELVKNLYK